MRQIVIVLFLIAGLQFRVNAQLVINELMQSNVDCIMDDLNEFPDSWVELYNPTEKAINLSSYKIGEKEDVSKAWQLPSLEIPPHGFLLIYCDKEESGLHTDFRLDVDKGASIYLFTDNEIIDGIKGLPKQPSPNIAYGRQKDGGEVMGYQYTPTPGTSNCGIICKDILGKPVFSLPGRIFAGEEKHPYSITLSLPEGSPEGTEIHYTTDGSEPTWQSPLYTSTIHSDTTLVLRAKLFCKGYLSPRSTTHSYIVHPREMTLPIISITTDSTYLYDEKIGIYVEGKYNENKLNFNYNWRRPMNFEFFEQIEETCTLNQLGEMRVAGYGSRYLPLKSLAIYSNKRFEKKHFNHEFFPDQRRGMTHYKSLLLRNAGNDFHKLYLRDALMQSVMSANTDVDWQAWSPSIVYINGKYKGMLNIRERSNSSNIYTNYSELDNIDVIENWGQLKSGTPSNFIAFRSFYNEDYHTLEEYEEWMDCNEFTNVMLANLFFDNKDFPGNNITMWRPRSDGGKWRFILKDMDFGFGDTSAADYNTIEWLYNTEYDEKFSWGNVKSSTILFRNLMQINEFRHQFIEKTKCYIDSFLNYDYINNVLESMFNRIKSELPFHREQYRLGNWTHCENTLLSMQKWIKERPDYFLEQLETFYSTYENQFIHPDAVNIVTGQSQNLFYSICGNSSSKPHKGFNIRYYNGEFKKFFLFK